MLPKGSGTNQMFQLSDLLPTDKAEERRNSAVVMLLKSTSHPARESTHCWIFHPIDKKGLSLRSLMYMCEVLL